MSISVGSHVRLYSPGNIFLHNKTTLQQSAKQRKLGKQQPLDKWPQTELNLILVSISPEILNGFEILVYINFYISYPVMSDRWFWK